MTLSGILCTSVSTTTTAIPTCIARSPNMVMHHFSDGSHLSNSFPSRFFFPSFQ